MPPPPPITYAPPMRRLCAARLPPPPPPVADAGPKISPDLFQEDENGCTQWDRPSADLEMAVWVLGDYPQVDWNTALRRLYAKCIATTPWHRQISAISLTRLYGELERAVNPAGRSARLSALRDRFKKKEMTEDEF